MPWLTVTLTGLAPALGLAQDAAHGNREVDYLELGARLVADGNYERAAGALRNVDTNAKGVDLARYHTLRGLVALRQGEPQQAIHALDRAIAARQAAPARRLNATEIRSERLAFIYLAQAHYQLGHFEQTLEALDRAGPVGANIPTLTALRAESHWQLNERVAAFAALNRGVKRFPNDSQFLRRKIFYLIDMGFFNSAADLGERYLKIAEGGSEDYLAIGSALRQSRQFDFALNILERARLRYPYDRDINIELAHAYLDSGKDSVAAELFARTAAIYHEILPEAAELERRAGHFYRALLLNTWINDQEKKLEQRLTLMISQERWEMAASMGGALARNGLLSDDDIRYAWAYSLFKGGAYNAAERALAPLDRSDLFDKAVELRRAMEICRQSRWQCS